MCKDPSMVRGETSCAFTWLRKERIKPLLGAKGSFGFWVLGLDPSPHSSCESCRRYLPPQRNPGAGEGSLGMIVRSRTVENLVLRYPVMSRARCLTSQCAQPIKNNIHQSTRTNGSFPWRRYSART